MKNAKRMIAGLLAILMLLGVVFVATGCSGTTVDSVKRDPEKQLIESYNKTKEALKNSYSASPLSMITQALKKGSVKIWGESQYDTSDTFILYADQANKKYAMTFETEVGLESGNSKHTTSFYVDENNFAIHAPNNFGETIYGINLDTMKEDMKNSQLWEVAGISYNEFIEMFDGILNDLQNFSEDEQAPGYLEFKKMLDEIKAVTKECTITVEEHGVLTGMDMVTAINIKYSMSIEQMNKIIDIIFNWAENSSLKDILSSEMENNSIVPMSARSGEEADNNQNPDATAPTEDTTVSVFDEMKAELKKAIADAGTTVTFTTAINPQTQLIMKAEMELNCVVEELPQYIVASVDFGKDPASSPLHQMRIAMSNGEEEETSLTMTYEKMDATGLYDRHLKVKYSDAHTEETVEVHFQWNKTENTYTLVVDAGNDPMTIKGKCKVDGKKLDISAESVETEKVEAQEINGHIVAEIGAAVPAVPQYVNLFQAPKEDLEALLEMIENASGSEEWEDDDWEDDWGDQDGWEDFGNTVTVTYVTASGSVGFSVFDTEAENLYDAFIEHEFAEMNVTGTAITKITDSGDPDGTEYNVIVNNIPLVGSLKDIKITGDIEVAISPVA